MKYELLGFSQEQAVKLGLSVEDLVILRWFVDFLESGKMQEFEHKGEIYVWVNYRYLLDDMPIINCTKKTLARKLQRLVDAGVIEHATIKQGGVFSTYRLGDNFDRLCPSCKSEKVTQKGEIIAQTWEKVFQKEESPFLENGKSPFPQNGKTNIPPLKDIHLLKDTISPKAPSKGAKKDWPGFDDFYAAYPKHSGKAAALKAWNKLKPNPQLQQLVIKAVEKQKQSQQWTKDGGQFIPLPATWLNGQRWEDELEVEPIVDKPYNPYEGCGIVV